MVSGEKGEVGSSTPDGRSDIGGTSKEQRTNPESLMGRIAERDPSALVELYTLFAPSLLGMVSRMARPRQSAASIVEEAFVHLWNEAPRNLFQDASAAVWVVLTARQLALERRRQPKSQPLPECPLTAEGIDPRSWLPRPEEVARLEEKGALLRTVINQLPKPQRVVLELAVFEGLSEAEIAAKFDEPLGRVKSSLQAGMRFIRHRMRALLGTWSANI